MEDSNEPKFTPGPWEIVRDEAMPESRCPVTIRRVYDGKKFVNDLVCSLPVRKVRKTDETLANANAISELPNLYACLKEAAYEMCVRTSGEELCRPCRFLSEDTLHCSNNPGKCFVQKWLGVLRKAGGIK